MTSDTNHSESDNSGSRGTSRREYRNVSPGRLGDVRRVIELIEKYDGEISQQTLISETGWSAAKTSAVVDVAEGIGLVVKFEFGRENYLFRPATAPTEVERLGRKVAEGDHRC